MVQIDSDTPNYLILKQPDDGPLITDNLVVMFPAYQPNVMMVVELGLFVQVVDDTSGKNS